MTIKITNPNEPQTTINYLRADKFFRAKNIQSSNLRNLFEGLAIEVARSEGILQEISDEFDPSFTTKLLSEWEKALGIPDDVFPVMKDATERRNNILLKLTALGVSTKEGFEALALILGFVAVVYPGIEKLVFPYTFPFILNNVSARWVMYVEAPASVATSQFPYTFPFVFGEDTTRVLVNLFKKLVPSPVHVIFNFI